jgi:pilus assembly protein TadC
MKLLKKYVILLKMTRIEDLHKESFVKTISTLMMIGMTISIMKILLLMMLLLYQHNCRLPHGPHHTSHLSSPCMMGTQIRSSS